MWNDANLVISINQKAIKLFGLDTAAYFAVITQIVPRVMAKQTTDERGFFLLDRHYVEEQCGLNIEKQYNCDTILVRNGILLESPESRDKIQVDLKRYLGFLVESDPSKLAEVTKRSILPKSVLEKDASNARAVLKAEERAKKAEQLELERIRKEEEREAKHQHKLEVIASQKQMAMLHPANTTEHLKELAGNWVDSIYANKKYLSDAEIPVFFNRLMDFSSNQDVLEKLYTIAITRCLAEPTWVISAYCKSKSKVNSATKVKQEQKVATETSVNQETLF